MLKLSLDLLKIGRSALRTPSIVCRTRGEQIAAQNANESHDCTSFKDLKIEFALFLVQAGSSSRSAKPLRALAGYSNGKCTVFLKQSARQFRWHGQKN
jgi:hypothetical protein